jgi:hypothetical protein
MGILLYLVEGRILKNEREAPEIMSATGLVRISCQVIQDVKFFYIWRQHL